MSERRRARARRAASIGAALWLCACAGPPPHPPTAVVDLSPGAVCLGDGMATPVAISGRRSAAALSLVPAPARPEDALSYRWRLDGAAHVITAGSLEAAELEVVTAGDRPLHVTLTVRDPEGGEATSLASLGVIVPAPACDDGCGDGTECVEGRCLPVGACDDDAGCPACFACVEARCVPAGEEP